MIEGVRIIVEMMSCHLRVFSILDCSVTVMIWVAKKEVMMEAKIPRQT
jgi:hypothetical protein